MTRVGMTYSQNAVPVFGGPNTSNRATAVSSATPMPGSGSALPTVESEVEERSDDRVGRCAGNNDTCGARAAKGTEWCVGHLRSRGEL